MIDPVGAELLGHEPQTVQLRNIHADQEAHCLVIEAAAVEQQMFQVRPRRADKNVQLSVVGPPAVHLQFPQ